MQDHGDVFKLVEEALLAAPSKGVPVEQLYAITRRKFELPSSKEELSATLQGSTRFDVQQGKVYLPTLRLTNVFISGDDLRNLVELAAEGGLRKVVSSDEKSGTHVMLFWDFGKARQVLVKLNKRYLLEREIVVAWAFPRMTKSKWEVDEEDKEKEEKKRVRPETRHKGAQEQAAAINPEAVAGLLKEMQLKIEREKIRADYEAKLRRVAELNLEEYKIQEGDRRSERKELFGPYASALVNQNVEPLVSQLNSIQTGFAEFHGSIGQLKRAVEGLVGRDAETQNLVEGLRRHFETLLYARDEDIKTWRELHRLEVQTLRVELAQLREQVGQLKDQACTIADSGTATEPEAGAVAESRSGQPSETETNTSLGHATADPVTEAPAVTSPVGGEAGDLEKCDSSLSGCYI